MQPQSDSIESLQKKLRAIEEAQKQLQKHIEEVVHQMQAFSKEPTEEKFTSGFQKMPAEEATALKQEKPVFREPAPANPSQGWFESPKSKPISSKSSFGKPKSGIEFEKFIGENIIAKIGILITVIGVGIGAKYAIDNNLISPLTRIILGYLSGGVLLGIAFKIKRPYKLFSAILLSGAMAIFYLITLAAYSYYDLIPQTVASLLMAGITIYTVYNAWHYNIEWIAIFGMAGAYGVPFLVGDQSVNIHYFFVYISLINIGILLVAARKYWTILYHAAFGISWLIFIWWYKNEFDTDLQLNTGLFYSTVFFITFYSIFLIHKTIRQKTFDYKDILFLLLNSLIYFLVGFAILDNHPDTEKYTGLFSIANALIHGFIAFFLFRKKGTDQSLMYMVTGLSLLFLTITIPIQFGGSWITLFWAGEAAILFAIGRIRKIPFYETLSLPPLFLTIISQVMDWQNNGFPDVNDMIVHSTIPVLNMDFGISLLVILLVGSIPYLQFKNQIQPEKSMFNPSPATNENLLRIVPIIAAILFLYISLQFQLTYTWSQIYISKNNLTEAGSLNVWSDPSLILLGIWKIDYTLIFLSALGYLNILKIKREIFAQVCSILTFLVLFAFLSRALPSLLFQSDADAFANPAANIPGDLAIGITRYFSYLSAFIACYILIIQQQQYPFSKKSSRPLVEITTHVVVIGILTLELLHWMFVSGTQNNNLLSISILWGVYALFLMLRGILKNKQHLRISAIVLFGITLIKLFLFDLNKMTTIGKTIVFISLGVLLLIVSFLYNKYKDQLLNTRNLPDSEPPENIINP